mgnify:CR=1 FL=1
MAMQKVQTPAGSPPRPLARIMDSFVPLPAPEEAALPMDRMSIQRADDRIYGMMAASPFPYTGLGGQVK